MIEKWRYTSIELYNLVDAAYKACPVIGIRDLKVGDRVLDDVKNALVVTKVFAKHKPLFSGIAKDGSIVGNVIKCSQDTYKLITDDLMQYAGVDHKTAVIEAVIAGKPVPDNVVIEVKGKVVSSLESNKHTVLSHFGGLTFGRPPKVTSEELWYGSRDYYDLLVNPNYDLWFSMLGEWGQEVVTRVNAEIELYDRFLAAIVE